MSAPLILGTNSIKVTGYNVDNSVRMDTNTTFTRTLGASPTDADVGTVSFWFKKVATPNSSNYGRFVQIGSTGNDLSLYTLDDYIQWYIASGTAGSGTTSGRKYRDQSAWYHIIYAFDSRQATASNRIKIYVNGELQDSTAQPIGTNVTSDTAIFDASHLFCIGATNSTSLAQNLDGYLAEFVYVDGQQLDATSFGEFNEDSPTIWQPIDVSELTFGNNGFYLDFEDSSDLGKDVSGNGNHFTANNLVATDQSTDTCTLNFATLNPLNTYPSNPPVHSEGNLQVVTVNADPGYFGSSSTIGVTQGKWYAEFKPTASTSAAPYLVAVSYDPFQMAKNGATSGNQFNDTVWGYFATNGNLYHDGSNSSYGDSYTTNDIIGVALDLDNHKLYFSKNGTFQDSGDPTSGATGTGAISIDTGETYFFVLTDLGGGVVTYQANFGSPPFTISSGNSDGNGYGNFEYSVPSGYYALNTKNLAEYG